MRIFSKQTWRWMQKSRWLVFLIALAGLSLYLIQSFHFAHYADLTMDEGTYLYKGWLFSTKQYTPYQDYGPWTQKTPLAYLIPGYVQRIFEPGLRTGRYLSIFLGFLVLVGFFLLIKRISNIWMASFSIWLFALNPAEIFNYTQAITQPLVAFLAVWACVCILGKPRSLWQIGIGGVLLASLIMARQNMLPVLALGWLYIFWEHGKRAGWIALGTSVITLIFWHVLYWPNILSIWTFLPRGLTLFLDAWRLPESVMPAWQNDYSPLSAPLALWEGIRYSLTGVAAIFFSFLLFSKIRKSPHLKSIIFLSITFLILFLTHTWAAFGLEYGSYKLNTYYSFSRYLTFFIYFAYLILVLLFPYWNKKVSFWGSTAVMSFILILSTGIGFGAYKQLQFLLDLQVPRTRDLQFMAGTNELWRVLANKYELSFDTTQYLIPSLAGFFFGIMVIFISLLLAAMIKKGISIGYIACCVFLSLSILLSPTCLLGGQVRDTNCTFDVIQANEQVGKFLESQIKRDALIYWDSDISPTPLLYLRNIHIFPPQLDQNFNIMKGGDPDTLYRLGYWNEQLATTWQEQADYLLISDSRVEATISQVDFADKYEELSPLETNIACRVPSIIHIYQKIK